MEALESSLESFFDALGELERAVDKRVALASNQDDSGMAIRLAEELDGLKAERASLASELERLKSQNKMYEKLTDEVNSGLDGAIKEIRSVLD